MIVYFADRQLNILGQASTKLPGGLTISDDLKTEDVETGVAVFECWIPYNNNTRSMVEACTEVGNYILRSHDNENEFYTIIDAEIDTKAQEVYIYAEDAGLDLLNEVVGAYEADKAYPISHYINKFAFDSGFEIGINEAASLTRKLSWDGEATATERIASVATQFGGFEVSYSYDIHGLEITGKYINIHKERGQDNGVQLRLNLDIDSIITKKSIGNIATALECKGGIPEDSENPITLAGYSYDDGDFYVSGTRLYSRKALQKWSRYVWPKEPNQIKGNEGHIVAQYSYDTISQQTLCANAITELKKRCDMEVNYEVKKARLPQGTKVGDWVNIVDDAGELYVAARILLLETSVVKDKREITLGEYLIKGSGISEKVSALSAQFAKTTQSVARASAISNNAVAKAEEAQAQASSAAEEAANAQKTADEATQAANNAQEAAENAQTAADNAQAAVDVVEKDVEALETAVTNAQAAADNAQLAANTAQTKADEASQAAVNAQNAADEAKASVELTQERAEEAIAKADTAQSTADTAKTDAATAQATADAAKLDAEQAKKDIAALDEELETLSSTMQADYARKTDLTETEASLQSQITQNAAQISSTVSQLATIDETANNAQEQAQSAKEKADNAKVQADQATADAQAAQTAAENAATAAATAQSEADTAKAAAATAQSVADKAQADLEAAQADLASVSSRVDATEEEIEAARQAVEAAQTAADNSHAEASTAAEKAAQAQTTADTAVTNAANAKTAADKAASDAALAQKTADEAKGNATAAQARAEEAATAAAEAQETADSAVANAASAQTKANEAAQAAADAQSAADDADAKAAQAQADLATAQQNLAAVTSRVDATEEEVEAAKADVVTAQAAADKAKEDAEAAQATADTAKANAATAQTAANNAKSAADAAQQAADDAQEAADEAQAAVDALAVRVTTAETNITQNSEQIALMAKKTEVAETLGGYYTKEETEAAIKLESDSIKSTVSGTYATKQAVEAIKIGGRNLVPVSKIQPGRNVSTTEEFELRDVWATPFISNENLVTILEPATQYTARYNLELIARTAVPTKFDMMVGFLIYSAAHSTWISLATQMSENAEIGTTKTYQVTFTTPDVWNDESIICYSRRWTTDGASPVGYDAFKVTDFKIEKGNKATDWTPALEDVESGIDAAQETADHANESATSANERVTTAESQIQQLSNCIATLVRDGNGESLMTQTEDGWAFNMAQITDTLDSATADIDTLTESLGGVDNTVNALKQAVSDLGILTDYVIVTTYNGQPCIELGEAENGFKLRITNTQIQFLADGAIPAWLSNQKLFIEKAEVTDELQFGGFVWKARSNGNMGLMWKGVSS